MDSGAQDDRIGESSYEGLGLIIGRHHQRKSEPVTVE
jgi:hypothetical protein